METKQQWPQNFLVQEVFYYNSKTLKPTLCAKGQQMKQLHVKRLVSDGLGTSVFEF